MANQTPRKKQSTQDLLDQKAILSELKITPGQRILDAGCGDGYMAQVFSQLVGASGKVYALDPDASRVGAVQKQAPGNNLDVWVGKITESIPLPDACLDLIYLSTVYHIFSLGERDAFNREVERLLKPGGKLAVIEIVKEVTPIGPPLTMRISPSELRASVNLTPLNCVSVGRYFYLQVFSKLEEGLKN